MAIATTPFVPLVEARAKAMGIEVPLLVLPFPFETKQNDEIRAIAHEKAEELIGLILARIEVFTRKRPT